MFDVGFSEMLVIGIVALVVIGPERLPRVARTIGHLMGRAQRYVNDVKRDIDREMQIDELRKLQTEMQDAARNIESSVTAQVNEVQSGLNAAEDSLTKVVREAEDLTRLDATPDSTLTGSTLAAPDADVVVPANPGPQAQAAGPAQVMSESAHATNAQPLVTPADTTASNPPAEPAAYAIPDHYEPDYSEGAMAAADSAAAATSGVDIQPPSTASVGAAIPTRAGNA